MDYIACLVLICFKIFIYFQNRENLYLFEMLVSV